jgi:hypothetical protein
MDIMHFDLHADLKNIYRFVSPAPIRVYQGFDCASIHSQVMRPVKNWQTFITIKESFTEFISTSLSCFVSWDKATSKR